MRNVTEKVWRGTGYVMSGIKVEIHGTLGN